jgi:hypothetical protein
VYERECKQYIGFGLSLTQIDPNRTSYDQYQKLVHKWHNNAQVGGTCTCHVGGSHVRCLYVAVVGCTQQGVGYGVVHHVTICIGIVLIRGMGLNN